MTNTVSLGTRKSMQGNKGKGTAPEMVVRRLLHGLGYRYRLHGKKLPGKPDLVFAGRRKVIFVHGCYWHQHGCKRSSITPKTNVDFWRSKLARNVERDAADLHSLETAGWKTLVVWECELKDKAVLAEKLTAFLDAA